MSVAPNVSRMELYGVSSQIPHSFLHHLLIDIDSFDYTRCIDWLRVHGISVFTSYHSPHGFHLVCCGRWSFEELAYLMPLIPDLDSKWFEIGLERGYWFLHNWVPVAPGPFQHMKLHIPDDNKWLNTKLPRNSIGFSKGKE